ncbi:exocyst complex component EXO70C1-like isoform X2 [Miscanthus floridulus]
MAVLERWFTELGVAWVLRISDDDASAGRLEQASDDDAGCRWIWALNEIVSSTTVHFPVNGRLGSIYGEEEIPVKVVHVLREEKASVWDQLHCARFIHEAMLRMLVFIDVIVAPDPSTTRRDEIVINSAGYRRHIYQKISFLLGVRSALSSASFKIQVPFLLTPSAQVKRIGDEMVNLLHAKGAKVGDAIWSTLEEIRTRTLESMEDLCHQTPQGSLDIHNITRSVMQHIAFILDNYSIVAPVVSEAAARLGNYVLPHIGDQPHLDSIFFLASHEKDRLHLPSPLDSMIMEMTSYLEGKLVKMSESFPDHGLRFLFLINNSDFIWQNLQDRMTAFSSLQVCVATLFDKVKAYMESYLQVSWAPLLSCLFNHKPLCLFGKNYSPLPLSKFESEFQKMYTTQKLWNVPNPEVRKRLRKAITEEIVSGYTTYIEDNNVTNPKFTPHNLKEMLQELFEG